MTLLASDRLVYAAEQSTEGAWIEPLVGGGGAIVVKVPEPVIKALKKGSSCVALLGVVRTHRINVLCLGVRVEDEPESPYKVIGAILVCRDAARPRKELNALLALLAAGKSSIHVFNELNHVVLSADFTLDEGAESARAEIVAAKPTVFRRGRPLSLPTLSRAVPIAMKAFHHRIHSSPPPEAARVLMFAELPLKDVRLRRVQEIYEAGEDWSSGPHVFGNIESETEGRRQERGAEAILRRAFPHGTFLSPDVKVGERDARELIDVLTLTEQATFLVSSKARSVYSTPPPRSSARRAASLKGHVEEAIGQLQGALRRIDEEHPIFEEKTKRRILVPTTVPPFRHALVLLDEMYFSADWRGIAAVLIEASANDKHRALFQVLDLATLGYLVERGREGFDLSGLLINRWMVMSKEGTAYFRFRTPIGAKTT